MYQLTLQLLDVVIPIYIYSWGGGKKWLQKPQIHLPLWVSLSLWDQYMHVHRCVCVCVCTQKSMWHWDFFGGPVVKTGLPMQGPKRDFCLWKFCTSRGMAKEKSVWHSALFPLDSAASSCLLALSLSPASLSCPPSSSHSPWVCCLSFRWHIDLKSMLYTGATTSGVGVETDTSRLDSHGVVDLELSHPSTGEK